MTEKGEKAQTSDRKSEKDFKTSEWKGLPQFVCKKCSFDTLDEAAMHEHIKNVHTPPKPKILVAKRR